jgi:hypothetical protein
LVDGRPPDRSDRHAYWFGNAMARKSLFTRPQLTTETEQQ